MNQVDIRKKIDLNNQLIKESLSPNIFTLNETIFRLLQENRKLQAICQHQYEDGYCIFCDKVDENWESEDDE